MKSHLYTVFVLLGLFWSPFALGETPTADDPASEISEQTSSPAAVSQPPVSSKIARQELQTLLDEGLRMLAPELVENGTFYPFVAMLGHDNEIRLIGTPVSLRENNAERAMEALVQKTRQLAEQRRIRAAGFFMDYVATRTDTEVTQPGIRVELNHIHPDSLSVFIPYIITGDNKLRLLTPQYKKGKNIVFASP